MVFRRALVCLAMFPLAPMVYACSDYLPLPSPLTASSTAAIPSGNSDRTSKDAAVQGGAGTVAKNVPAGPDAAAQAPTSASAAIYISPTGDDAAPGTSPGQAVRTIERAQAILKSLPATKGSHVSIRYLPGRHFSQRVDWDYVRDGVTVAIEPDSGTPDSVTIDGGLNPERKSYFLRLDYPADAKIRTGLTIRGLTVENYCEGVSLGDWKTRAITTGTTIEGNWFNRIGSAYQATASGGMPEGNCVAGIRLQRSVGNVIANNRFTHIENLDSRRTRVAKYGPGLLHAIYISSQSSDNVIKGNMFSEFTGSPVRIRDRSNNTEVIGNSFQNPIYGSVRSKRVLYAISQWYCNEASPACLAKARKGHLECPSENIKIADNRLAGRLALYADESQSKRSTCNIGSSVGPGK